MTDNGLDRMLLEVDPTELTHQTLLEIRDELRGIRSGLREFRTDFNDRLDQLDGPVPTVDQRWLDVRAILRELVEQVVRLEVGEDRPR